MGFEVLEKLYYILYSDGSLYRNDMDYGKEDTAFTDALKEFVPEKQFDDIWMLHSEATQTHEMQGFVNGFRLAMKMAQESIA